MPATPLVGEMVEIVGDCAEERLGEKLSRARIRTAGIREGTSDILVTVFPLWLKPRQFLH
jgi:hypothetical protein